MVKDREDWHGFQTMNFTIKLETMKRDYKTSAVNHFATLPP